MKHKYTVEYTDTFSGEANYSWVVRHIVFAKSDVGAVRLAKKQIGIENVRCRRQEIGETIALYPCGSCTVLFVIPEY